MAGVEGRVVVITGAGGGLGRQHALLFAQAGAKVVVNDVGGARDGSGSGTEMADAVVAEITDAGGEAVANYDSVATAAGGKSIVEAGLYRYGQVDIVVNNAGILRDVTFHKMTDSQWHGVLQVHLYGTYFVTHAAWPYLRDQGYGRVIVTTSTSGLYGNFGQANYGAAKLAMVGLINTLALEGSKYNVTANAVAPIAATRMTDDVLPADMLAGLDPAYVSPLVVHLAGEECTTTGEVILAGGGSYSRVRYVQAQGAQFDAVPTVEDLAARWEQVMDLDGAEPGKPLTG